MHCVHLGERNLSVRGKSRGRSSTWLQSYPPTLTAWGVTWAPGFLHPHLLLENVCNSLQKIEFHRLSCQSFLLLHLPSLTHQSHTFFKLSSFHILPSCYITKHSSLHFAYLNLISLFYFQSQTPYFSFYKFPLKCTWEAFSPVAGIHWSFISPVPSFQLCTLVYCAFPFLSHSYPG